jgi:hypothetical protein
MHAEKERSTQKMTYACDLPAQEVSKNRRPQPDGTPGIGLVVMG